MTKANIQPRIHLGMATLLVSMLCPVLCRAADFTVDQKDREFSRTSVTIKPGDTLTFKNSDPTAHNVYSPTPGLEFVTRRQASGEASTVPFPKEGVIEVRCSIHPKMKLMVTVKK